MSKYCTNCGKKVIPNTKFCTGCGNPIEVISQKKIEVPKVTPQNNLNTSKIKLVCDPYRKVISYYRWNGEGWVKLTPEIDESSKLVSEEYTTGFFPFKVKEIVDEICHAYNPGRSLIDLIFEGTDDDYKVLSMVCSDKKYSNKIICHRSYVYLNNARDIIHEVNSIFDDLKQLVEESVDDKSKVEDDLNRYSEAASEMIPICVFGNVSAGKSSFINALIGNEILPSGDQPTTAKIYKIAKSEDQNRAFINLAYDGIDIQVLFDEHDRIQTKLQENDLIKGIKDSLEKSKELRLPHRVGAALNFINRYAEQDKISDLIELEVPYDEDGILKDSSNKYVLFDTPGSNSASNEKHKTVLKNAMKNQTNGLPIFVATSDSLDTEDNLKLYYELKEFEDLIDPRFTMIVVNKADNANLPREGFDDETISDILRQSIPKKMFSYGIYYVSSIMGLGAKAENDGEFMDQNYARLYYDLKPRFSALKHPYYTQLYKYNILPNQINSSVISDYEECQNLVYKNSGMYCLERAIEMFANNYSAYNKCQQSQSFLNNVLEYSNSTINKMKIDREKQRKERNEKLQEDKYQLLVELEKQIGDLEKQYEKEYPDAMKRALLESKQGLTTTELKYLEQKMTEKKKENTGFLDLELQFEELNKSFLNKIRGSKVNGQSKTDVIKEIDKLAADDLFDKVKSIYSDYSKKANRILNENSKKCWIDNANDMKDKLTATIYETPITSDDSKKKLTELISSFPDIPFEDASDLIFHRDEYDKYLISIGSIKIGETNKLNLKKLERNFNKKLNDYIDTVTTEIGENHKEAFVKWGNELLEEISCIIQDVNPKLIKRVKDIKVISDKIAELEAKAVRLTTYTNQIANLTGWQDDQEDGVWA